MEYIYGNADKYKTRIMEEYARAFYREMQFIDPISKSIKGFFRILRCCDDKVICYRHIDESLKEDLENMNNGCSKMTLGKNWFISAIKHDKFENSYTFALYNGSAEIMTMKEYICYQVNYFFESLLGLAEKKNGDVEISIRNMIYENAIAFVDRKINNTINMAMGPRVMLAENISKISYLHYEGNKVNKKYIVWGIKKEDCDIIFSNDIMFNDETKLNHDKQIRKLLEITYKDKNNGLYLGCCGNKVEGYISSENLKGELYLVEFNGTGKWSFGFQGSEKNKIIFEDKKVKLFKDDDKVTFYLAYKKIFEEDTNIDYVWKIVESARNDKMRIEKELCQKFPTVLKDKLLKNEIEFPETTKFEYEDLYTYRAVERNWDDNRPVSLEDFKSYFELGKKPKRPRGVGGDITKDPHYYGVSSFLDRRIVEQKMKFPNPKKKLAAGYVYSAGGPQDTREEHVCWWLYTGADVSGFKLIEEH